MNLPTGPAGKGEFVQIREFAHPKKCHEWNQIILDQRDHWIKRDQDTWSYGNVWYFDIAAGRVHRYFANAINSNRLIAGLPGYLDVMRESVRHILAPDGQLCLETRARHENLGPYWCESGLHIYTAEYGINTKIGMIHQDLEGLIPYPQMMFDEDTFAYSAVLSVAIPEQLGGLSVWKTRFPASNTSTALCEEDKVELDYEVGTMTIIDSFMPHQIQNFVCSKKHPFRITGVMHFLYRSQPYPHWEYWF